MGSWSVSCGISNIAITSGNNCVILPLKRNKTSETRQWKPATLPIFGKYNDYGGIEDILKDDNTSLIENYFGVSIEDFCTLLLDGVFTYDRGEASEVLETVKNKNEISEYRFMWIDKSVYDFMTSPMDKYYKGYNDYGTKEFMDLFGFKLDESIVVKKDDNYDTKRFSKVYKKDNLTFYSDGNTLLSTSGQYVYHYGHGNESSLEYYFEVPKEFNYLKDLLKVQTWSLCDESKKDDLLGHILGDGYRSTRSMRRLLSLMREENVEEVGYENISEVYNSDYEKFGNNISKLYILMVNLHPMSGQLCPHVLYLTPQCGEYKAHQKILEKFSEINKDYIDYED